MIPMKKIGQIADINPRPSRALNDHDDVSFLPMKAVEELSGVIDLSDTRKAGAVKKGYTPFQENDVLFAKITPCMENGKVAIAKGLKNNVGFGSTEFFVFRCGETLMPKYLFYFLIQDTFRRTAQRNMAGAVGQLRVPRKFLEQYSIPSPDIEKQGKTVCKVEELFSELDFAAKEVQKAQSALDIFEISALRNIFNIEAPYIRLNELGKWHGGGTPSKSISSFWTENANILWITPKDMKTSEIVETKVKVSEDAIEQSSAKLIKGGSVLFVVRSGILRRVFPISYTLANVTVNQDMKAFTPNDEVLLKYVYWYCRAFARNILTKCAKDGTTVESIDTKMLMAYPIKVPKSLSEQQILVDKCEQTITELEKLRKTTKNTKTSIRQKRQSILSRAFKGDLV